MDYLFLALGLGLLLLAADLLVDSSVAIAQRAHVSNFIIGLTIVGMGTSSPELFVSISSALSGSGDVAMGNVVGSNIANILLILGVSAVILPFAIERGTQRRDIPFGIFATVLLLLLSNDKFVFGSNGNTLSRIDGIIFLMLFVSYMIYVVFGNGRCAQEAQQETDEAAKSKFTGRNPVLLWAIAIASLAGLIFGGNLFLESAKNLARAWGMSEAVIAITIVAVGTSLPELITSIVAACKNNPQLALGNVLGSNVFNIFMIVGITGLICPMHGLEITNLDLSVMLGSIFVLWLFSYTKYKIERWEGAVLTFAIVAYMAWRVYNEVTGAAA
jgi:cation:H+ antiporter